MKCASLVKDALLCPRNGLTRRSEYLCVILQLVPPALLIGLFDNKNSLVGSLPKLQGVAVAMRTKWYSVKLI